MHPSSSSLSPPPAAVGVPELASTARAAAFAEVSRLLQHPEHLRRLPQLLAEYEAKRKVKESKNIDASIARIESHSVFVRFLPSPSDPDPYSSLSLKNIIFLRFHRPHQANAARLSSAVGAQVDAARATTALLAAASSSVARLRECYKVGAFFLFSFSASFCPLQFAWGLSLSAASLLPRPSLTPPMPVSDC